MRFFLIATVTLLLLPTIGRADTLLQLHELIDEALRHSPEIKMAEAKTGAARHRIPQAESLTDPMIMFGYQNDGFASISYPEMADSQLMFSVSQMLPYPGKRALKGEMASQEAENLLAITSIVRNNTVRLVTELFYDLFLSYKNLDIIRNKAELFSRLEEASSVRYASGMGSIQEVVMAQTEKYMLLEKETMQKQKITSIDAMLTGTIGRTSGIPLGIPAEPAPMEMTFSLDETLALATNKSPVIAAKQTMISAAQAKIGMAEKEYYPDFTVTGTVADKGSDFQDMWSITTSINIPIYFQTKQREGVFEAKERLIEAQQDLETTKLMLAATIRDNFAMAETSEKLMTLYKDGLIPKSYQDYDLALNSYMNGRIEAFPVINRLRTLLDLELLYWEKFTERAKAITRIEAAVGVAGQTAGLSAASEKRQ